MVAIVPSAPAGRSIPAPDWPLADPAAGLAPFEPFPVEVPFRVRPDLVKLAADDEPLRLDADWAPMLRARRQVLSGGRPGADEALQGGVSVASAADPVREQARCAAIWRAVERLAGTPSGRRLGLSARGQVLHAEAAGFVFDAACGRDPGGGGGDRAGGPVGHWQATRPDAGWLAAVDPSFAGGSRSLRLLGALALTVQEDLVLMEADPLDGRVRTAAFQVAFPSAWDPARKVGLDLTGLHGPVADNAALQAASSRLGAAMVGKGPFVRWVWTLTADSRWRAWPPRPTRQDDLVGAGGGPLSTLWFRIERQVTVPLGDGYGLFLIRVQRRPLADVIAAAPDRLDILRAALASMSASVIAYKGLGVVRDALLHG